MRAPPLRWFVGKVGEKRSFGAACLVAFIAAASSGDSYAQPDAAAQADDDPATARARASFEGAKRAMRLAQSAISEIPAETYDPRAVLRGLGPKPEGIWSWVREETTPLAYPGVLRGWRGVLMDRQGSGIDRALLLAELLERAGHKVRLAHALLGAEQAQAIFDGLPKPADPDATAPPLEPTTKELEQQAERRRGLVLGTAQTLGVPDAEIEKSIVESELAGQRLDEQLVSRTVRQVEVLGKALGIEPTPVDTDAARSQADAALLASLSDHWWVEVSVRSKWKPLDLFAPKPWERIVPEEGVEVETTAVEQLSGELFHRLEVQVVAEQLLGSGALKRHVALEHRMRVSDLVGEHFTVITAPLDWPADLTSTEDGRPADSAKVRKSLLAQTEWLPSLEIGDATIKQSSITVSGTVNKSPAITLQSRKVQSAAKALQTLGTATGDTELVAVVVRYGMIVPGASVRIVERFLLDLVGPAARASGSVKLRVGEPEKLGRALGMATLTHVLTQPCWYSAEFVSYRGLAAILRNRVPLLGSLYSGIRANYKGAAGYLRKVKPVPLPLFALAAGRASRNWHHDQVVLSDVNLLSYVVAPVVRDDAIALQEGFDIMRNDVGIARGASVDGRYLRLLQGVLDTNAEALALPSSVPAINTAVAFDRAVAAGATWKILRQPSELAAADLPLDEDSLERVRAELKSGRWVVTPAAPVEIAGSPRALWWGIDGETGMALGMAGDGRGQAIVEYEIKLFDSLFSIVTTLAGSAQCLGKEGMAAVCCAVQNAALGGVGLGVGRAMSWAAFNALEALVVNVVYTSLTSKLNFCD